MFSTSAILTPAPSLPRPGIRLLFSLGRQGVHLGIMYMIICAFNAVASYSPAYIPVTNYVAEISPAPVSGFIRHLQDRADDSDIIAAFEQGIEGVSRDVPGRILPLVQN